MLLFILRGLLWGVEGGGGGREKDVVTGFLRNARNGFRMKSDISFSDRNQLMIFIPPYPPPSQRRPRGVGGKEGVKKKGKV